MASIYNTAGIAGNRSNALRAYYVNQAIEGVGNIANLVFQYAQMKDQQRVKEAELATSRDVRSHNATTLLMGTVGSKMLDQPTLENYERTLGRIMGNPDFVLPRNLDTEEIEIPPEWEKDLVKTLIGPDGSLNETGRAMYAAANKKPTPFQEGMDDLKETIREYGHASPEAQLALSALEKAVLPSMSQQQARDWMLIPPAQRINRLLKGNDTTIKMINISPAEREKMVENRVQRDITNDALKKLKGFVKKHGDVFGRLNLAGWKLSFDQLVQSNASREIRNDYRRAVAPIYRMQQARIKEMTGTAQNFGEQLDTKPWKLESSDDLVEIVAKVKSAAEELEFWRRRRAQASAGKGGVPQFGDFTDFETGEGDGEASSLLDALRQSGGLDNLTDEERAVLGE